MLAVDQLPNCGQRAVLRLRGLDVEDGEVVLHLAVEVFRPERRVVEDLVGDQRGEERVPNP
jgi:hypothetical protein